MYWSRDPGRCTDVETITVLSALLHGLASSWGYLLSYFHVVTLCFEAKADLRMPLVSSRLAVHPGFFISTKCNLSAINRRWKYSQELYSAECGAELHSKSSCTEELSCMFWRAVKNPKSHTTPFLSSSESNDSAKHIGVLCCKEIA